MKIDERLLSKEELKRHTQLQDWRSEPNMDWRWQFRVVKGTWLSVAVWLMAVLLLVWQVSAAHGAPSRGVSILLVVLLFGGPVLIFTLLWAELKSAAKKRAADYLVEIGYHTRKLPERSNSTDDGPNYWMTGGYDPDRYYSYSRQERDLMQTFGMNADEWDANMGG